METKQPHIRLELDFDFANPDWDFVITMTNRSNFHFNPDYAKAHHSLNITEIMRVTSKVLKETSQGFGIKKFWTLVAPAIQTYYINSERSGTIYVPPRTTVYVSGDLDLQTMSCECDIRHEELPMGLHLVR